MDETTESVRREKADDPNQDQNDGKGFKAPAGLAGFRERRVHAGVRPAGCATHAGDGPPRRWFATRMVEGFHDLDAKPSGAEKGPAIRMNRRAPP